MMKSHLFYLISLVSGFVFKIDSLLDRNKYYNILLSDANITDIDFSPASSFKNVIKITLNNLKIKKIPDGIENFPALEELVLTNNSELIDFDNLKKLTNLKRLTISNQQLTSVLPDIANMLNLTILKLSHNQIQTLPAEFKNLKKLFSCDLSHNKLTEIPEELYACENLILLYLNNNSIELDMNPGFEQLKDLNTLELENNKIKGLNPYIFHCKNLEKLKLNNNRITKLPDELKLVEKLTNLSLGSNQLDHFPMVLVELLDFDNLQYLDLGDNKIHEIPMDFKTGTKLAKIILRKNLFTEFPPALLKDFCISELDLSYNKIKEIPKEIVNNRFLSKLEMRNCELTAFPSAELLSLEYLEHIDFSFNQIYDPIDLWSKSDSVETEFIEYGLRTLNLSGNKISKFPQFILDCPYIHCLQLNSNELSEIPLKISKLLSLSVLELNHNNLNMLPVEFEDMRLTKLDLSHNQFTKFPEPVYSMRSLNILDLSFNEIDSIEGDIGKLTNLQKLHLEMNNIETWPDYYCDSNTLSSLDELCLTGNLIKTFPKQIFEMKNLKKLWIDNNQISELESDLHKRFEEIKCLMNLRWNYIPLDGTIDSTIEYFKHHSKRVLLIPQFNKPISVNDALKAHQQEKQCWNIQKLSAITIETNVVELAKDISDQAIRVMWRSTLKYNLEDEYKEEDFDTESNEELSDCETLPVNEDLSNKAIKNLITQIGQLRTSNKQPEHQYVRSIRKMVGIYLRYITQVNNEDRYNLLIKSYLKILFVKLLEEIARKDEDAIEVIKAVLTNLCKNSLLVCETGQLEGIKHYYALYYMKETEDTDIEGVVKKEIASLKEASFVKAATLNEEQTVHYIHKFREIFEELLGITNEYEDPYKVTTRKFCERKAGNILETFLQDFSVQNTAEQLAMNINKSNEHINMALDFLKDRRLKQKKQELKKAGVEEEIEIHEMYSDTIKEYFHYSMQNDTPTQSAIKEEGVIAILLEMGLIEIKE